MVESDFSEWGQRYLNVTGLKPGANIDHQRTNHFSDSWSLIWHCIWSNVAIDQHQLSIPAGRPFSLILTDHISEALGMSKIPNSQMDYCWNCWTTIGCIARKVSPDIRVLDRMNYITYGDPLDFHLAPSSGQKQNLTSTLFYDQIPVKLMAVTSAVAGHEA